MKRSRAEIVYDILTICREGANKTRIVYQANLNFRMVNPYLDLLAKNGLIDVVQGHTTTYKTTSKGSELLERFRLVQNELYEA
ncbi:MAG: hypothetical protein A4E45_01254 [Methanosaeta sp. PtaB.Bin039]|nr:MAG: hypothetical protein A4E45_01254 [Methanosaeta sp. PtaB.Bin039]OPY46228.1 MAG: hypothetical protein A4E47_00662 [Methanosaeta sp. PtaU1.Bin028]HOT07082.1 winged helix-turn-helix domain-containing protein [Methanotrichaceae archaeon]HQF17027.1 winged helix-turn-helix domain-containing protein [Methanotrichaceae archaeon]HQI91647.1 winged helix-turn-helix domain-containing protein [Methanotrichaceae archaeon]